jgi:hypothetical protein
MTVSARIVRRTFIILVAAFGIVVGALFVVVQTEQFRVWLQTEISHRADYDVRFTHLALGFPLVVVAEGVKISQRNAFQFNAQRIAATFSPLDVWSKTIHRLRFEQPMLSLDLDEIMKTSSRSSVELALRNLNVGKGTLVIKKGQEMIFELAQIDLNAQNLNLGQASGITLRADLPALKSQAEIVFTGQLRDWQSQISVQAKQSGGLFSRRSAPNGSHERLHADIKFRAPDRQNASAVIESKFNNFVINPVKLTGSLDVRAELNDKFTEINFSGRAAVADFPNSVSPTPLRIANGDAKAEFAGNFSTPSKNLTIKSFRLSSPNGNVDGTGEVNFGAKPQVIAAKLTLRELPLETFKVYLPEPFSQWSYLGKAQATAETHGAWNDLAVKGNLTGDKVQVRSEALNVAQLSFFAPFNWTKPALRVPELKLAAAKLSYSSNTHWQTTAAQVNLDGALEYEASSPVKLSGNLQTAGVKFASPDSARVGENFNLSGSFQITADSTKKLTRLNGRFSSSSGELLWEQFFGDFKNQSPSLEIDADYWHEQDRLECRRCSVILSKVGRIEGVGSVEKLTDAPVLQLRAQSANFSPSGFFDFFLRENFSRQYPILAKIALGGQLNFQLALQGKLDALTASGDLALKGGELRALSDNWQIGPIALNLPFQFHLADISQDNEEAQRTGTLRIDRVQFGNQTIAPIATTVSLANNTLRFHQPVILRTFGGEIEITNLLWSNVIKAPKQFSFSAEAKRLQLPELTDALSWPRFNGSLSGSIPQVQVSSESLKTNGEIQADLFGGRLLIGKLEIDNPFSGLASIKLDAKLAGIQLEQLSQTFEFGRISGILEGSVENLVMTAGQIAEMRADLHSVDRGGEQRISVEALNKITVLSSGEDAGALYGGLAGLFDSFRYSKLGFKANLKNDRLTLRGVESDGDKELLVVGSFLPPTVNIISHTQNIAFSELLRRLERIKNDKANVK